MKRVFKLEHDTNFQIFKAEISDETRRELYKIMSESRRKGLSLAEHWQPLAIYLYDPDNSPSDFANSPVDGGISISQRVYDDGVMRALFESAGELLPMIVSDTGETRFIFRLLSKSFCSDVVDEACSARDQWKDIINYAFYLDRLPDCGIFSLPRYGVAYAVHSEKLRPEKDFIQWYLLKAYKGLRFEEQIGSPPAQTKGLPKKPHQ